MNLDSTPLRGIYVMINGQSVWTPINSPSVEAAVAESYSVTIDCEYVEDKAEPFNFFENLKLVK